MFVQGWPSKKRERDEGEGDGYGASGFGEHRTKRRISCLPHRTSPKLNRHVSPPSLVGFASLPAPPTITPADSDCEEMPGGMAQDPSRLSYSSSPSRTLTPSSPSLGPFGSSQPSQMSDTVLPDDSEMTDSALLSPGAFHNETATTISSRIPTPIHNSFAPQVRAERTFFCGDTGSADEDAFADRFVRGRNLPSPISEGEMSPSGIANGLSGMQMDVEDDLEKDTPTKKGHTRSKHSLRSWTGPGEEQTYPGAAMKRTFTIGYRADCEKCWDKVPGHFSHIITY